MRGRNQAILNEADFLRGVSSSDEVSDGGFSPAGESLNLINTPGILYAPAQAADIDTDARLTDEVIATSPDMVSFAGTNRLLIAENGSFYTYNGTKIPAAALATDAVRTYAKGFTDLITYAGRTYYTSKEAIGEWQSPSTFTHAFFAFTNANRPHPAIVFENNAYYADRNLLLRQTSAGGAPATILTLSVDHEIIALGIDPGTGKMLIATTNSLNISNTLPGIYKVLWYDGFSSKVSKSMIVEGAVTAFHHHAGQVYVAYDGDKIGYLTGSGITFLRKLLTASNTDSDQIPWKHSFASIGKTMYVIDGDQVLAYGEVIPGRKVWYYAYDNKISSPNKFKAIFNAGSNKLGLSVATTKLYALDITSVATIDKLDLYTNWIQFPRPVVPTMLRVELAGSAANTANWDFTYRDQGSATYKQLSARIGASVATTLTHIDVIGFQNANEVTALKLRMTNSTNNAGIKRLILYYDPVQ